MRDFKLLFIIVLLCSFSIQTVLANSLSDWIAIRNLMHQQIKYSDKYDYYGLFGLYSNDFKSADGFDKTVYFKLIGDTWKSYPNIAYTTKIKKINLDKDKASVDVHETSTATIIQTENGEKSFGLLSSDSDGTYYLKKDGKNWLVCAEKVDNEKSTLRYGDTRFINMDLTSPKTVKAGEYYTATLTIDTPQDAFVVASISRDNITYPQTKAEDVFRKLPEDNILERMFLANKSGNNEYNVASIGLTKSKVDELNRVVVYMAGVAFIMNRVNIEAATDEK